MQRRAPTFFLPECSRTRRVPVSYCPAALPPLRPNRPAAGRVAYVAGGKCHHRDQRRTNRERGWRLAVHGVAVGGTAARIGREGKNPTRYRILPGESPRYFDSGYAETTAERQPFRGTHLSFFQDGFDESRSAGIGTCRRAGRRRRPGGRANRRTRTRGTQMAFRARGGHLCDFASSAETGARASSPADHDGRPFRAFRGAGPNGAGGGPEVAE